MEITILDKTVSIELDDTKRVGVLVSGGMDSAILLFLILTEIINNKLNVDLTIYNVPNVADNAKKHSQDVVTFLEKFFNIKLTLVNIGSGADHPLALIKKPATELITTGSVDVLYSGQNQFPEEASSWTSYKEASSRFIRRDPNLPDSKNAKFPFLKLNKHHILEIYKQFNMLELAKITHSCTTLMQGNCGTCLWCEERAWAFTKLGLIDAVL